MGIKTVKLQNIVMQHNADANLRKYSELMHRGTFEGRPLDLLYNPEEKCHIVKKYDTVDFTSYFNCLQVSNWKQHTFADNFKLAVTFSGKGVIELIEVFRNSKNVNCSIMLSKVIESEEKTQIIIDIPATDKPLVSFNICAHEELKIYDACYMAEVQEENIRNIKISMVSTTFKKEAFIKNNIKLIKEHVLSDDSDMKGNIFVHVIDNGRTLNPEEFNCEDLMVYPNPNVGGSGGFTRGMIEAIHLDAKPTHILLMDDDVMVMHESLFRLFYLLRIVKPEYEECFVSGAMFDYDLRETQYEDVGYVHKADGSYGPLKNRLDMRRVSSLLDNEEMGKRVESDCYAGWWFCCIPMTLIDKNGLPLPVFVRGDDVEFSIRNNAKFLTLNGIAIWHVGFAGKFNAAMELYQVHRNSLVIQAASYICKDIDFIKRMRTLFWKELTRFAYNNAEQILDAIDDFMQGPDFLKNTVGELCLKEHAGKNDKLVPISELPSEYNLANADCYSYRRLNLFKKAVYVLTINGHLLPGFMLRRWPEVVAFDWFFVPGKNFRRKRLIALNPNDNTACIREMSRKRCFKLIKRYRKTMKNYKKNHLKIEQAYRNEFNNLTSEEFWREYLGI